MKLTTCTCPGTGTRIHTAMPLQRHGAATALSSWRVGGGIIVAALSTPPVWAVPPKRLVITMLLIIMEEREGSSMTVGPRQSTCLSPTDTNLLLWRDLALICLILLDQLKYTIVAHLVDLKFLLVTNRTRALGPHTTKTSETGHFILPNFFFFQKLVKHCV